MMLTTIKKVKARLGIDDTDPVDDDLLTNFVKHGSARFEQDCNRRFEYLSTSEEFSADERELRVARYPIDESVTASFQLMSRVSVGWQDQVLEYIVRSGCVISLEACAGTERDKLKVTFTGGYALPGATYPGTAPALPDDLEQCLIEQCVYWYQNRDRLGAVSASAGGGSVSLLTGLDLLPVVTATLKKYERWLT